MHTVLRIAAVAFAAAVPSLSMTTCCDIEHATMLYADGSGKLTLTLRIVKEDKAESPEEFLADLTEVAEGVVAWTEPRLKEESKLKTYTVTAYFDDAGKFRWYEDRSKRKLTWSFDLNTKTILLSTLQIHDRTIGDLLKKLATPPGPDEKEDADTDLYAFTITVPGNITKVEGLPPPKGRTAGIRIETRTTYAARKGDLEAKKRLAGLSEDMKIRWSGSDVPKDEFETFKKELAAAKENWKARLEPKVREIIKGRQPRKDR